MKNLLNSTLATGLIYTMFFSSCGSEKPKISTDLSNLKWKFQEKDSVKTFKAKVPGSIHMDLLANGEIPDPYYRNNEKDLQWIGEKDWVYTSSFTLSDEFLEKDNLELNFKGLDTYADVYLNDSLILKADNFFKEWTINAKSLIQKGENSLKIVFNSAVAYTKGEKEKNDFPIYDDYSFARKPAYHFGWDWGPIFVTAGIWKPIEVVAWDNARILNLQVVQEELSDEKAELSCVYEIESDKEIGVSIVTRCANTGKEVKESIMLSKGINKIHVPFIIDNPKRWWSNGLGEAYLYNLEGSLQAGNIQIDQVDERIGLRTVKLVQKPDAIGKSFYFELNGVPVFMKGANYIPQDMFLNRPTEKEYQTVIDNALAANMNMLRVWGGGFYENDIFYDLCDEKGLLVWQDFMFACSMYPGDKDYLKSVEDEAVQNVKRLRNHPSIALWCGNNENYIGWKDWGWSKKLSKKDSIKAWDDYKNLFDKLLPKVIEKYDADRFYWPSSPLKGWGYPVNTEGDVHYWGIWHAQEPFENFQREESIGRFMSEYGFQGTPEMSTINKFTLPEDHDINSEVMLAHQKHRIGYPVIDKYMKWYYNDPKDFEAYLYVSQVQQAFGMGIAFEAHRRAMPHCMGTLYWQINDCYPVTSWASVDYYGKWKALHYKTRDLYKEMLVSPFVKDDNLDIYIVSDNLKAIDASLEVTLYDLAGKVLNEEKIGVKVKPNTSAIYYSKTVKELLKNNSKQETVLVTKLFKGDELIASNNFFFVVPKDLKLSNANISITSREIDKGYELTFTSDVFAKGIFLSTDSGEGSFSDNFFDIIPGNDVKTIFTTNSVDLNIEKEVKIYSLIDSYK